MIKRWSTETALPATQTGYGILIRVCECVTEKHALNWQTVFWIPLFCEICVCGWPVSLFSGEFLPVLLSFIEIYSLLIFIKLMRQIVWDIFAAELLLRSANSLSVEWFVSSCVQQTTTCSQLYLYLMTRHCLGTWELIYAEHKTAILQNKKENLIKFLKWRNNQDSEAKLRVWCLVFNTIIPDILTIKLDQTLPTTSSWIKDFNFSRSIDSLHHFSGKEGPAAAACPTCPEEE